jgi:hypothetical protein
MYLNNTVNENNAKFTPQHATQARMGCRAIAVLFREPLPSMRVRVGGQSHAPAALPPGKDPVRIV